MIGAITRRFFHSGKSYFAAACSNSSMLGKLRKATGYSISNCRKALEMFPEDTNKAEEWLHGEAKKLGWSKWNKIQNRSAAQGLIGVYTEDTLGIMVEVNCETDFVARNAEFQQLVGHILLGCLAKKELFPPSSSNLVYKHFLDEAEIMSLKYQSTTIQELLNAAICKFNEKTVLKRAVVLKAGNFNTGISGLTHPVDHCAILPNATIGKFGTLVAYRKTDMCQEELKEISINICRQIIGMNPLSIGYQDYLDYKVKKNNLENSKQESLNTEGNLTEATVDEDGNEVEDTFKPDLKDTNETRLLFQPYLMDSNLYMYDYILEHTNVEDFERFECGAEAEKTNEENKSPESVRI